MIDEYSTLEANKPDAGLEIHGPFQASRATVGGYRIPYLSVHEQGDILHLVLDERFSLEIPKDLGCQAIWFIANAMAVAAGYSCFGENSQVINRFKNQMIGLKIGNDFPDEIG